MRMLLSRSIPILERILLFVVKQVSSMMLKRSNILVLKLLLCIFNGAKDSEVVFRDVALLMEQKRT
jgi:hypothetical protein